MTYFTASVKWYCAVKLTEGVQEKSVHLEAAQKALGEVGKNSPQAIFLMRGSEVVGNTILPRSWVGGAMWWGSLIQRRKMERKCSNEGSLINGKPMNLSHLVE